MNPFCSGDGQLHFSHKLSAFLGASAMLAEPGKEAPSRSIRGKSTELGRRAGGRTNIWSSIPHVQKEWGDCKPFAIGFPFPEGFSGTYWLVCANLMVSIKLTS